jgi:hypothetical protein
MRLIARWDRASEVIGILDAIGRSLTVFRSTALYTVRPISRRALS